MEGGTVKERSPPPARQWDIIVMTDIGVQHKRFAWQGHNITLPLPSYKLHIHTSGTLPTEEKESTNVMILSPLRLLGIIVLKPAFKKEVRCQFFVLSTCEIRLNGSLSRKTKSLQLCDKSGNGSNARRERNLPSELPRAPQV